MADIAELWLIGNVAADAEANVTSTGKKVSNFRVATNVGTGEERKTSYHPIVAWEDLAEQAHQFARKGVRVSLIARPSYRSYESKKHPGEKVYVTEFTAQSMHFLSDDEDLTNIKFGE